MARKKKTVVAKARDRRDKLLKPKWRVPNPLTEKQRTVILALLTEGATLSEVCTIRNVASYGAIYATRVADDVFDAAVRQAMAQGAEAAMSEAAEVTKSAVESGITDDMRIAESFHRCAVLYAEKIAPKEFGQLVKLGNVDGGPLSLHVVNYALPAPTSLSGEDDGKARQLADASRTRDIEDATFEEFDAA